MAVDSAGFENYLRGSWWDVQIHEERAGMFLVSYNADKDEDGAWVPMKEMRMSCRRADGWDCPLLKKGMDVSVVSKHPLFNPLSGRKEGLYDATVSSVARSIHAAGECTCKFSIKFFSLILDTYTDECLLDRYVLTDEPETQVSLSDIRILQKPTKIISLTDLIDAHVDRKWIPMGRGCWDAYFLAEIGLSPAKKPRAVLVDCTGPTRVRSCEVLSPPAARVETKNGDKESNWDPTMDGSQLDVLGSQESPGTPQEEYRISKKSLSAAKESQRQKPSGGYADDPSPESIKTKRKCYSAENCNALSSKSSGDEEAPKKMGRGRPPNEASKEKSSHDVKGKEIDLEGTEALDLSSGEDSDGEWKPNSKGPTKVPTMAYNIRSRDKFVPPKPKSEGKFTGKGRDFPLKQTGIRTAAEAHGAMGHRV